MKRLFFYSLIFMFSLNNCSTLLLKKHEDKGRVYISTITDFLTKFGFFDSKSQLLDETIVVYTLDSSTNKPAPNIPVEIVQNKDTIVVTSDSSARVYFKLSKNYLGQRTYLKAQNPAYFVFFTFNASGYRDEPGNPSIVRLRDYHPLLADSLVVFYPDEQEHLAQIYLRYLKIQSSVLKSLLGFTPRNWGLLLTEKKWPIHFFEPIYLHGEKNYHIFAYSLLSDSLSSILLTNVHEWCESEIKDSLNTSDPNVRWIQDGISEFSRLLFALHLPLEERKQTGVQAEIKQELLKYYTYISKKHKKDKYIIFDLKHWELASLKKVYSDADKLGYPLSLYFWLKITEKHGNNIIVNFLRQVAQIPDAKNEDYINLLRALTGEDIRSKLSHFETDKILRTLESEARKLGIHLAE